MEDLPSKIATNWGTRTLKKNVTIKQGDGGSSYYPDEVDGSAVIEFDMDLVDVENIAEVRKRATSMKNKRILLNRFKVKTIDSKKFAFQDINVQITKIILKKYHQIGSNYYISKINFIDKILRRIEGKFGFTVLSFFQFLWWLFLVNFFLTILIILFLILPQSIMPSIDYMNDDLCKNFSFYQHKALCLNGNQSLEIKPCLDFRTCYYTDKYFSKNQLYNNQSAWWMFVEFLQGTGWMENTFVFLGSYSNKLSPVSYDMQVAVLLISAIYFFIFLLLMISYSSQSIQQRMTSSKKLTSLSPNSFPSFLFANKLFSGWDFTITDPTKASSKCYQLKIFFTDMYRRYLNYGKSKPTLGEKIQLWIVRFLVNIAILILIIISLTAIVVSIIKEEEILTEDIKRNSFLRLLVSFIPAITVVFFNTVMPFIFNKLIKFEEYSPEYQLNLMLIRSVIINLTSVLTLVISVGGRMLCNQQPCDENILCWETYIGQQLYKLSLVDFAIEVIAFVTDFIRKKAVNRFPNNFFFKWLGLEVFNVPKNTINVINKQAVCWLGIFVAPALSLINSIKLFIHFFMKFFTLMTNCKPTEEKTTFESSYFFVMVLLITFFICTSLNAFAVGRILPSPACGPYRVYGQLKDYMSYRISVVIENYFSTPIKTFILFIGSWMFFIVVVIVLCLLLLYYQSLIAGNKKLTRNLREQLSSMQADNQTYKKEIQALRQRNNQNKEK